MRIIILTIFLISDAFAAFELGGMNAFINGTANSSVATNEFFSAFLINPAITSAVKNSNLGLHYFRPYGLKEVNSAGLMLNTHIAQAGLGFAIGSFGNSLYRENQVTLNASKIFYKNLAVGINFHWYSLHFQNYGNMNSFGLDGGVQFKINPRLTAGFSVNNFNQPTLNGYSEEIPIISRLGISAVITEHFRGYVAVQKDAWFPINVLFGMNFNASSLLSIQSGFNTYPSVPVIGFRVQRKWMVVNYVFQYHFDLGATHFWGISFTKEGNAD